MSALGWQNQLLSGVTCARSAEQPVQYSYVPELAAQAGPRVPGAGRPLLDKPGPQRVITIR